MGSLSDATADSPYSNGTAKSTHSNGTVDYIYSNGGDDKFSVRRLEPTFVRPAAKTPEGLYFLSNIDQTLPYAIEIIFTYKGVSIEAIKESLAQILVEYYPFAGCLATTWDGKMMVRCTGEGVRFVEAVSNIELEKLGDLSVLEPVKLQKLVYRTDGVNLDIPPLTLQVTRFNCGGIALGAGFNHVFTDGISFADFLNSWAESARKKPLSVHPFLDRSILSPRQTPKVEFSHHEYLEKKNTSTPTNGEAHVYRSFSFDPQKLNQLKRMAEDKNLNTSPTSFEVITALAWLLRTKSLNLKAHETTKLLIAVDVRSKFSPPLPKGYFGNAIAWTCAKCQAGELVKKPLSYVVKLVQDAIQLVTEDYIRSEIDHYEVTRAGFEFENTCYVTKWSRLPFYDVDFGYGQPNQVAPASLVDNLMIILSQGNGSQNQVLSVGLPSYAMEVLEELMDLELGRKQVIKTESGNGYCTYSSQDLYAFRRAGI